MAVQDNDLFLVQRGNTPFRETSQNVSTYVTQEITAGNVLPPIASAAQLGVIRVGTNLAIDGDGILSAVIPPGVEFMGEWTDAANPPANPQNGQFWVWTGASATLTNADWQSINGNTVNEGDRLQFDDGPDWTIIIGGGGGISTVTGTAPIVIGGTADQPDVSITAATTTAAGSLSAADKLKLDGIDAGAEVNVDPTQAYTAAPNQGTLTLTPGGDDTVLPLATTVNAGLMSGADKTTLDNLVANPGGVVSITAGDGIDVGGTAGVPIVSVEFGAATPNGTPTTVMPFDISMLGDLP
jgi:hypothetical protein